MQIFNLGKTIYTILKNPPGNWCFNWFHTQQLPQIFQQWNSLETPNSSKNTKWRRLDSIGWLLADYGFYKKSWTTAQNLIPIVLLYPALALTIQGFSSIKSWYKNSLRLNTLKGWNDKVRGDISRLLTVIKMAEQRRTTTCSSCFTAELATASHSSLSERDRLKGRVCVSSKFLLLQGTHNLPVILKLVT
jgi:hypothetical protein